MRKRSGFLTSALVLLTFLGCSSTPPRGDRIVVTASIFPLADIVANIGGDLVDVIELIPPGASPHVFDPSPEAFRKFSETRLFVMVGAGLEFWAEKLITATANEELMVIKATDGVSLFQMGELDHENHEQHDMGNPHVWLDPIVAGSVARRIAQSLAELDPDHAQEYRTRAVTYQERLEDLDGRIQTAVNSFRIRKYVAFHPAWSYFARRYGLEEVGVIQESPGREPTPRHIEKVIRAIEAFGIETVFAEPQFNPAAAEAIAAEAGVKVLILDPLGGPDLPGRDSYIGLMEYNLEIMRRAMG